MDTFLRYFTIFFSVNSRKGTSGKLNFLHKGEPHSSKMMGNIEQTNLFLSFIVPMNYSFMENDFKDILIIPLPEFHLYQSSTQKVLRGNFDKKKKNLQKQGMVLNQPQENFSGDRYHSASDKLLTVYEAT